MTGTTRATSATRRKRTTKRRTTTAKRMRRRKKEKNGKDDKNDKGVKNEEKDKNDMNGKKCLPHHWEVWVDPLHTTLKRAPRRRAGCRRRAYSYSTHIMWYPLKTTLESTPHQRVDYQKRTHSGIRFTCGLFAQKGRFRSSGSLKKRTRTPKCPKIQKFRSRASNLGARPSIVY